MAEHFLRYEITLTEMPHFRRIVGFVDEVELFARRTDDDELLGLVDDLRSDLAQLMHDWKPDV